MADTHEQGLDLDAILAADRDEVRTAFLEKLARDGAARDAFLTRYEEMMGWVIAGAANFTGRHYTGKHSTNGEVSVGIGSVSPHVFSLGVPLGFEANFDKQAGVLDATYHGPLTDEFMRVLDLILPLPQQ